MASLSLKLTTVTLRIICLKAQREFVCTKRGFEPLIPSSTG
jgi:hypothetical protein